MAVWKVVGKQQHCGAPRRLVQGLPTLCGDSVLFVPNSSAWRRCPMLRALVDLLHRGGKDFSVPSGATRSYRSRWPRTLRITTQRSDKLHCMSTLVRKRVPGPTWTRRKKVLTTLCLETSRPHLFSSMLHLLLWLTSWRRHLQRLNLRRPLPVIECETSARFTCPLAPVIERVSATPDDTSASNRDFLVLVNPQFRTSCEQNTLTRHIYSCFTKLISLSHMTLAQGSRLKVVRITSSMLHAQCLFWSLFDSPLCTLHRLSHLPFHSPDLHLHLPCGLVRGEVPCALQRMRS